MNRETPEYRTNARGNRNFDDEDLGVEIMFGMDLFKMAGIELPVIETGEVVGVIITTENNRYENDYADWKEALTETLKELKHKRGVTHISFGRKAA